MNTDPIPDLSSYFPPDYWERAREGIARIIEENWDRWTVCKRRYLLVSLHTVVKDDVATVQSGTVTGRIEFHVYSDNLDYLRQLWQTPMFQQGFDTTVTHFIVDTHERKTVELLSICA